MAAVSLALTSSAVAQGEGGIETLQAPPRDGDEGAPQQKRALDPARLMQMARDKRTRDGCAAAAPAYRVVAGMGEGQEAAQNELGECLLDIKTDNPTERVLFRQEGVFWLTRAAYAGNARSQRRLAMENASPAGGLHDPEAALKWALLYDKNPDSKLYGFGPLPPTLVPGLRSSLDAEAITRAEIFAAGFTPLPLAKFDMPAQAEKKGRPGGDMKPPPGGRRRPG